MPKSTFCTQKYGDIIPETMRTDLNEDVDIMEDIDEEHELKLKLNS